MQQKTNNWQTKKLGEVCRTTSGGTPSRKNKNYYSGTIPWVKSGELDRGIIFDTEEKITEEAIKNSSAKIFPKGTLLIALYGATIGKLAFLGVDATTNQAVCGIYENENIISKYLYYFLLFNKPKLVQQGVGGAQPNISQTILKDLDLPIPPLETQHAIVSKIEELFSELDKGIAELKTAQQQLKTYRQSVLKSAFEGKLTEEWRKNNVNIDSIDSLINNLKNDKKHLKTKPLSEITNEEQNELFDIPKSWKWIRNEEYLYEVKDGTHDTPKYITEGIPFVTQKNIKDSGLNLDDVQYISEEDHKKFYQRSNVTKGDILISMIGHNRGMSVIVDTNKIFSIKNVGLFKFNNKYQFNKFSFYFYQSKIGLNIILKKSKGGAQPFIGLTELRNWPVVVCSLEEQHRIVQEIESRLSVADKMEQSIQESLQKAEALRQSILKKAFRGELV